MALPAELQQNLETKINQYEEEQKVELLSTMEDRGMQKTFRQNILDLLQVRFLSVPETLVKTLNNIEDLASLKQLLLETIRVNSMAEFEELIPDNSSEEN
ncbi:hypothetical protein [Okeania sp.]|uniref:hypothetical protein n=1 Tax=Okeania sp. TaxID=3100323 RepID=UPI002B4B323C|nr:hypothetical protein [Okeania sp.]MEB3341817.1 hypothetical protein [Okeania sp.]